MTGLARIVAIVALLAVGGALGGCQPGGASNASGAAQAASDDAKLWQGDWRLVSATHRGQTDHIDGGWQVNGDRYVVTASGNPEEHWQFTLDPGARRFESLATFTATDTHQDYLTTTGNTDATCVCRMKGLYEVSHDRLRVVFDPTGRDYPSSFDIPPDSLFTIYVFERPPG